MKKDDKLNDQAINSLLKNLKQKPSIQYYPDINIPLNDNDLIIVDITADDGFSTLFKPNKLADFLIKKNLTSNVQTITLLISDINPKNSLIAYAGELANALKKSALDIKIQIATDLNSSLTLLLPPDSANDNWKIYGLSGIAYTDISDSQYDKLIISNNKKLLKEVPDILAWCKDPERQFQSTNQSDKVFRPRN